MKEHFILPIQVSTARVDVSTAKMRSNPSRAINDLKSYNKLHTEEVGIQLQAEEVDLMAAAADLDEIKEVNTNCILMANLQQASTSGTQSNMALVYDSYGLTEVHDYNNCYNNEIFNIFTQEEQYIKLLEPVTKPHQLPQNESNVISEVSSREQGGGTVNQHSANVEETRAYHASLFHNLAAEVEKVNSVNRKMKETNAKLTIELARYKNQERVQNFKIQFLKEANKFVRDFQSLAKEADESLSKHKELELEIERLLRAVNYEKENAHLKTAYKNLFDSINVTRAQTKLIIDSLPNKLRDTIYENAKLRAQLFDKVSEQKDTTKGTSTNTKFSNQSTERKPFFQYLRNKTVVRQPNAFQSERPNFSKTRVPQKVDKTNDLSNPFTSNSVPTTKESKVVENDAVISPGMFKINPFKNFKEVKYVPNKPVNASVRSNLITDPQPHVITKKVVNFDLHGFSSRGVDITTRPKGHSLGAIQRMIGFLLRLRVGMDSHSKKQKANVSDIANQTKHKAQFWIPNNVRSKERLASPNPSKLRMRLRWSPTGKMFDIKGKPLFCCDPFWRCNTESFHEQTDEELTENDINRMDADDPAIQTILLGLPGDVYAVVDSCETTKEIWEHVRQMMKGSDIGEQKKKATLFNEWEKFTSTDRESIESYYHRFMQLMNDLKRNKHFPENIVANLKFLNNLQPEWKRHVTIVRQTKNLHEADFTKIYDFLKMN
uniref:Gag-Pol polyprotein n=1 Tax=Tanacetum cinerariifolium TaxID=118510 RepID=A0A6L2P0A4_TANCI|nr:Gag-Pol polyprotein [Tanacetum cinerariifolium]